MPWPISDLPMITVTVSSGAMRRKALGAKVVPGAAAVSKRLRARQMPTYSPAPAAALPTMNWRRSMRGMAWLMAISRGGDALKQRSAPMLRYARMQLEFFGAAGEVTGSCHIVRAGGRQLLLDCGMIQGGADAAARNRLPFPFEASAIDAVVLSHAHVDHCGRLPLLVKRGFRGPIYTNAACADLLPILLRDSADLALREAERARRELAPGAERSAPLFDLDDVDAVLRQVSAIPYDLVRELLPGFTVRVRDAGHILGSSSIEL